jgi:hypothetical protein
MYGSKLVKSLGQRFLSPLVGAICLDKPNMRGEEESWHCVGFLNTSATPTPQGHLGSVLFK